MRPSAFLTVASVFLYATLALGQSTGVPAGAGGPWTQDRALGEGGGLRTGAIEWHPGISTEFGYDSNYLQRADSQIESDAYGPVVPSLRLRVTPRIAIRSHRELADGADGDADPPFLFDAAAVGSYNDFISLEKSEPLGPLRSFEGGGHLNLDLLPGRRWAGRAGVNYMHHVEPSNQGGGGETLSRHTMGLQGGVDWAPGGGRFRWTVLEYGTSLTLFDEPNVSGKNNAKHHFTSYGVWRFLPKTGILYDARLSTLRYASVSENGGEALQARLGINGLLTKKVGFLAMGGWAASFFRGNNGVVRNYNSFVTHLEAKWFLSAHGRLQDGAVDVGASTLSAGYMRDFHDSYIGDFYRRNRLYGSFRYLIGSRVVTTFSTGVSRLDYPDYFTAAGVESGFGETRFDLQGFAEYRPLPTVGINLQLLYDVNASQVIDLASSSDDLSFSRFRAILGARWFL